MTGGRATTALEGAATIKEVTELAFGRIQVLPAGRINSQNVGEVVSQTGCGQVHGSFSGHLQDTPPGSDEWLVQVFKEISAVADQVRV